MGDTTAIADSTQCGGTYTPDIYEVSCNMLGKFVFVKAHEIYYFHITNRQFESYVDPTGNCACVTGEACKCDFKLLHLAVLGLYPTSPIPNNLGAEKSQVEFHEESNYQLNMQTVNTLPIEHKADK